MPSETYGPVILSPSIANDISYYDGVWQTWVNGTITTSSASITVDSDGIWQVWTSGTASYTPVETGPTPQEDPVLAQARRQQQQEQLDLQHQEASARAERHRESEQKALELLRASLNPEQRRQLEETNGSAFDVLIDDPRPQIVVKRSRFRITRLGEVGEVEPDGTIRYTYCIVAPIICNLPVSDVMLAKKLMLECHPEDFFRIANRHVNALPQ